MMANDNIGPIVSDNTFLKNILEGRSNCLNVGHANCQSICPSNSTKLNELRTVMEGCYLDVFGVSETWLKPYISTKAVSIPGYTLYRNDRPVDKGRGGGVGLYVSSRFEKRVVLRSTRYNVCESIFVEIKSGT